MKKKTITLEQTGIVIQGIALLNLWGGGQGEIIMDEKRIPLNKVSKENILRCVNDARFGCESIESAVIEIYTEYDGGTAVVFERTITVDNPRYREFYCRGII